MEIINTLILSTEDIKALIKEKYNITGDIEILFKDKKILDKTFLTVRNEKEFSGIKITSSKIINK